jgi:hypothetical protein
MLKLCIMHGRTLSERLFEAQIYADRGDELIDEQKRIIASLKATGADVRAAEKTLKAFEESQARRLREIESIMEAMEKLPPR